MRRGKCFSEENEACRDRDGVRDERREAGGGQSAAVLERRLEHARAGCVADDQRDQREQPDAAEGDELRGNVTVGEEHPAASPSVAARERLMRTTIRATAAPAEAASQITATIACGVCEDGSEPTSDTDSKTSPTNASTTASCSWRDSLPGRPRTPSRARTAMPEALTAWTRLSGARRRAAT